MEFGYEVVQLWEQPVEAILAGGPTTLPLAVLGKLPEGLPRKKGMQAVVDRLAEELHHESPTTTEGRLLMSAWILSGLRLPGDQAMQLFERISVVRESTVYQAIVEEGQVKEALRLLFHYGRKWFGEPTGEQRLALESISKLDQLENLHDRITAVDSWEQLLEGLK
jgi:hypothetical protein